MACSMRWQWTRVLRAGSELRGAPADVSFKSEADLRVDLGAIDLDDTWDYRGKAVMMVALDVVVGPVAG